MASRCTAGCPRRFARRDCPRGAPIPSPLTEEDLAGLPATVQRYLHAMGVVNRPRDSSFMAHVTGRFRLKGQGSWMPAEVWQYNNAVDVARIFHMRIDAGQTVTARVFLDGDGRPVNFRTADRYADLSGGLVRAEWTTPMDGWQPDGDRFIFTRGSAVWQLPEGALHYMDFQMSTGGIRHNLAPTDISTPPLRRTGPEGVHRGQHRTCAHSHGDES